MQNTMLMQAPALHCGKTFCGRFSEVVQLYPDSTAVFCKNRRLTYRELEERSDILAYRLIAQGVKREDIIAIDTGRSVDTIVAMLGIWKAGAAYFYLNPNFPESYLEELRLNCRCPVVIDNAYLNEIDWSVTVEKKIDFSTPESLALLIFTSGSTAKPKGVMIEHRNILAMSQSVSDFAITHEDAVCLFPSFSFVASVSDIFPPLLKGAAVYIIEEEFRRDIHLVLNYFLENRITVSFLPPHMAARFNELEQGRSNLRLLLVGSDNMRNLVPQGYEIRHVYGASEMCSLIADYVITDVRKIYPVGCVKSGMRYYIVGQDEVPVNPGQDGELWLSGPQVSRGYFCNPQKTAEHYMLNPFCWEPGYERVFKTGDIVRQLEDGNLLHICRKDNMFKIRGYRVEADAVESVMLGYPGIKDAVVKAFPDARGNNILCGYFLSQEALNPKEIKAYMREHLPHYMIPACLIRMEEFPRNLNNKVSRMDFSPPVEIDDHKLLEKLY